MATSWKFNEELTGEIIDLVEKGHSRTGAGLCCGITVQTMCAWMRKGREAKSGKYFKFFRAIKKAEGGAIKKVEHRLFEAATDPKSASHMTAVIFFLKMRLKEYQTQINLSIDGEVTHTHEHLLKLEEKIKKMTDEELVNEANQMKKELEAILVSNGECLIENKG